MDINFTYKNLTCCSLELFWNYNSKEKEDIESYELFQREGGDNFMTNFYYFESIYKGKNTSFEVINLKPNQNYAFKIKINKKEESKYEDKTIEIKTLNAPHAFLSENSVKIANFEFAQNQNILNDFQEKIIKNCCKFIFEENNENILDGNFNGIRIKITHEIENNIYYISFDLKPYYFAKFFNQYIKECDSNRVIIPCHFIIQSIPTLLILNLLENSSVILTGTRFGGVIASSLGFYILNIGKSIHNIYGNTFLKNIKNSNKNIGIVTFGSPSFLSNMTVAVKMQEFTSYFYHIKDEFDFIPEIVDFISYNNLLKDKKEFVNNNINIDKIINIFNNIELANEDIELLNNYLTVINFTKENLEFYINKFIRIHFGHYFLMKESDFSLIPITEDNFKKFYYLKKFHSNCPTSHLKIYKNLETDFNYSKKSLDYLVRKDNQIEFIKIMRRINENESNSDKSKIKVIIKFKLNKKDNGFFTPDIIKKITLFYPKEGNIKEIIIGEDNIFYDNDTDITAYTNIIYENMNININNVTITNHFLGELNSKYILNIKGSGPTRKMLFINLEKIFLIAFFKLIEIFYISYQKEENYNNLKEENFGKNFEELKILRPFEKQIKVLDELLLFTRPDILANNETKFLEDYVKKDLKDLKDVYKTYILKDIMENIKHYYKNAKELQNQQKYNCLKPDKNSLAKELSFPQNFDNKTIKKLFMCKFEYKDINNFISKKFNNSFINDFYIEKYIIDILRLIEEKIRKDNPSDIKDYLNKNIGEYYNLFILPKVYFIRLIILISIESGDIIKFSHKLNWTKFYSH